MKIIHYPEYTTIEKDGFLLTMIYDRVNKLFHVDYGFSLN